MGADDLRFPTFHHAETNLQGRKERIARNGQWDLEDCLARGDKEFFSIRAAEGQVGANVLGYGDTSQELAFGCDHINARRYFARFAIVAGKQDPGGDPEIAAFVETHAVAAAAAAEVEDQALAGETAVIGDVERPDLAIAAGPGVAIDDIKRCDRRA